MIVLDTNVVSEALRLAPEQRLVDWLDRQPVETLYLTATSLAELHFGVDCLPEGRRKRDFGEALDGLLDELFSNRILPFDALAAREWARLLSHARRAGRAISAADGQIAAIASTAGFSVATRDDAPFIAAGLAVINPWRA